MKKTKGGTIAEAAAIRLGAQSEVVAQMARAETLLEAAKLLREAAREKALALHAEHGIMLLTGEEGVVTIKASKGATRIDVALVRELVSKDVVEQCTVVGKPGFVVAFEPGKIAKPIKKRK